VDVPFVNKAFALQNNLHFPLLSDYTREISRMYVGVYENFAGLKGYSASKRAVCVVGPDGKIKYEWITENPGVEPDYDAIVRAMK
jgi:peroxiredoxin